MKKKQPAKPDKKKNPQPGSNSNAKRSKKKSASRGDDTASPEGEKYGLPAVIPNPDDEKNKGGRPTDYKSEYDEQVYKLALLGATDREVADFFEVSESTINLWKLKHQGFSESIRAGKTKADASVAEKLYSRTQGCLIERDVPTKVKTIIYDENTGKKIREFEEVVVTKTFEQVMPDVRAQEIWLNNRKKDKWKHRQEHQMTGKDGEPLPPAQNVFVNVADKEQARAAAKAILDEY